MDQTLKAIFTIILILFSGAGWSLSFYFYGVYRKIIADTAWWIPTVFQMAKCNCGKIVDSRYGRILGQSNSFWGIFYYSGLIVLLAIHFFFGIPSLQWIVIITAISFLFTVYLMWGLYRLRIICRTCLGVHTVNLMIFLIILIMRVQEGSI